jgi:RNA polymerase sigma-70 factor (ECF subfamily)
MSVAMKYSRDNTDAKEIVSLAFLKALRSLTSFDSTKGSFYAWLKKIIFNEALDHIKQRSRFSMAEMEKADEPYIASDVIKKMDEDAVMELIRELPPATHAVFILFVVDGYGHKEIAEKLKIKEGTSKWHLSEARNILQQKLNNQRNS